MTGIGVNPQFNNFNWQNIPYQMPASQNYNTNFNLFNNSNFNIPAFNYNNGNNYMSLFSTPASSSSKKEKTLSFEERRKKIEENADKIKAFNEAIADNKAQMAEIKAMKDENGNVAAPKEGEKIETLADRKKMPWYKRTWKAVKAMVTGVFKMGTDFIGFENGKFNLKKCLKNVGFAAIAVGLCALPVVGPILSTTMLCAGLGMGVYKVGNGIVKAAKAKTAVERDRAFEDIGAGAAVTFLSGRALTVKGAAFANSNSALASKGNTKFGQFIKDTFVNPFKATKFNVSQDVLAIRNAGGGFKGYGSVIVDKTKASWAACKPKETFDASLNSQKQSLANKIAELDAKMGDPAVSAQEKAMLQLEKATYETYAQQLDGLKTKSDWFNFGRKPVSKENQEILTNLQKEFAANGRVEISGQAVTDKSLFDAKIQEIISAQSKLSSDASKLLTAKDNAMARMGVRNKRFQTEVDEYLGGHSDSWFKTQWDINKMHTEGRTWYQNLWTGTKGTVKGAFQAVGLPFKPYQIYLESSSGATPYHVDQLLNPYYQVVGEAVSANEILKALNDEQKQLKDELAKIYKN